MQFKASPSIAVYNDSGAVMGKIKFNPSFSKWEFTATMNQKFDKEELKKIYTKMSELK